MKFERANLRKGRLLGVTDGGLWVGVVTTLTSELAWRTRRAIFLPLAFSLDAFKVRVGTRFRSVLDQDRELSR